MLRQALEASRTLAGGSVASSIPELAEADPELLAAATCTVEGRVETAGDAEVPVTVQSISKAFVYGWAVGTLGTEAVHACVGAEPTGDAFDSIVTLESRRHRPHNPMVNAGAIAVTGLFLQEHGSGSLEALRALFGRLAARGPLDVDESVYSSERESAHRNRAIAYLMRHFGMLSAEVDAVLDLYFRQCALLATCRDLAVMASTLAAGGRNPVSGERILPEAACRAVRAVMATCGLYDASGRFAFDVGLPAKSSISGGMVAVARDRLGVAAVSPRLDSRGNSVRGAAILRDVAERLDLHFLAARARRPPSGLQVELERAVRETEGVSDGRPAHYAETLARAPVSAFGIAACTVDGEGASAGDAAVAFSLQAVANPLVYALVSSRLGSAAIHERVGVEPSGNPFHAIVFDRETSRPFNPLGNAGAMATCSLVPGRDVEERSRFLQEGLGALAGSTKLAIDPEMLAGERAASARNHAIACLLRNFGLVEDEEAALELYLRACSLSSDCRTLARMGAALAAGGDCPFTGTRVVSAGSARDTLSLMFTCGLHDESGQAAVDVGVPLKSGISGALLAVVPGRLAIAAWSPRVNERGTSVRAYRALQLLASRLDLAVT